jgi:hypothetical protein
MHGHAMTRLTRRGSRSSRLSTRGGRPSWRGWTCCSTTSGSSPRFLAFFSPDDGRPRHPWKYLQMDALDTLGRGVSGMPARPLAVDVALRGPQWTTGVRERHKVKENCRWSDQNPSRSRNDRSVMREHVPLGNRSGRDSCSPSACRWWRPSPADDTSEQGPDPGAGLGEGQGWAPGGGARLRTWRAATVVGQRVGDGAGVTAAARPPILTRLWARTP